MACKQCRPENLDADNLIHVESSDGLSLKCRGCKSVVASEIWNQMTDDQLVAKNMVSDAARHEMALQKRMDVAEDKAKRAGSWKEAQGSNSWFMIGALVWVVFVVMTSVLNGR
jgi:hypothetical protein